MTSPGPCKVVIRRAEVLVYNSQRYLHSTLLQTLYKLFCHFCI